MFDDYFSYWRKLEIFCDDLGYSAKHVCRIARVSKSTRFGLELGADPRPHTKRKILAALRRLKLQ
ncbi:MAG: hypothetical protein H6618_09435 [Deltaproteobacteria bacterium]|nr:hypothetical protein [Deltaproteobacteria bacterium]